MSRALRKKNWSGVCVASIALHATFSLKVLAVSTVDHAEQSVVRVLNLVQHGNKLQIEGVGSGVVVDRAGFILTNEHVVAGADKIYVQRKTSSGKVRDDAAEVVAQDRNKDLALLRVRGIETPMVSIASNALVKGQLVYAIGFPAAADLFGTFDDINQSFVEATVTQGVVSRLLTRDLPDNPSWPLVQHSAAISAGSSGGALINACGSLVGINAAGAVEALEGGDFVSVAGFSYAIQAQEVLRFAKRHGANPSEITSGCEAAAGSPQVVAVEPSKGWSELSLILTFTLGAIAAVGVAVIVVNQTRKRSSQHRHSPILSAGEYWQLDGWTSSNDRVLITVIDGRHTETCPLLVGRDASCDAVISDPTVSRKHAKVFVKRGALWCADLGSSNGTKVNGKSCSEVPVLTPAPSVLALGNVNLRVENPRIRSLK